MLVTFLDEHPALRADLDTVKVDLRNVKVRVTLIEENMGAMNRRLGAMAGVYVTVGKSGYARL